MPREEQTPHEVEQRCGGQRRKASGTRALEAIFGWWPGTGLMGEGGGKPWFATREQWRGSEQRVPVQSEREGKVAKTAPAKSKFCDDSSPLPSPNPATNANQRSTMQSEQKHPPSLNRQS